MRSLGRQSLAVLLIGAALAAGNIRAMARSAIVPSPITRTLKLVADPGFDGQIPIDQRDNRVILFGAPPALAHPTQQTSSPRDRLWQIVMLDAASGRRVAASPLPLSLQPTVAAVDEQTGQIVLGAVVLTLSGSASSPRSRGVVGILDADTGQLVASTTIANDQKNNSNNIPVALAVDSQTGRAFLATPDGRVRTIDTGTAEVLASVDAGAAMQTAEVVDEKTGRVFVSVADKKSGKSAWAVAMLDASSGKLLRLVGNLFGPLHLTLDRQTDRVVVADFAGLVDVLDAKTGEILHSARIGSAGPLAVDGQTGHVFLVDRYPGSSVTVLDDQTGQILRRSISAGRQPNAVAVDSQAQRVFVTDSLGNSIAVLNSLTGDVVQTIRLGKPQRFAVDRAIAVDEDTSRAFVTGPATVTVLDTRPQPVPEPTATQRTSVTAERR